MNIKTLILLLSIIIPTYGYSQSYDFEEVTDEEKGTYIILTKKINPCMAFSLHSLSADSYFMMIFNEIPTKVVDSFKNWSIHLENGEVLSGKAQSENGVLMMSLSSYSSNRKSLQNFNGSDKWDYFLVQLQKYNIKKITFDIGSKSLSNYCSSKIMREMVSRINASFKANLFTTIDSILSSSNISGNNSGQSGSSGSTGSGSSRSVSEIELPLKLEAGPGLKMKLTSASEGFYSAVVPHEDWKGKATDYVVTVSTQTGKYLDDTSLEEFTLEKEGVFDVDPSWVSVRHNSTRALLLRVSPLYSSSSRYARIHIKVNGKEAGQIFLIQKAEGAEVE